MLLEAMLVHLGAILEQLGDKMRPKSTKIGQDSARWRTRAPRRGKIAELRRRELSQGRGDHARSGRGPACTPLEGLLAPKFAYLASSWRSCAPSCAILAHLGALGPHLVAKLLQDGAQLAQHSPTSRQDEPTWPPRAPPRTPKTFLKI